MKVFYIIYQGLNIDKEIQMRRMHMEFHKDKYNCNLSVEKQNMVFPQITVVWYVNLFLCF